MYIRAHSITHSVQIALQISWIKTYETLCPLNTLTCSVVTFSFFSVSARGNTLWFKIKPIGRQNIVSLSAAKLPEFPVTARADKASFCSLVVICRHRGWRSPAHCKQTKTFANVNM